MLIDSDWQRKTYIQTINHFIGMKVLNTKCESVFRRRVKNMKTLKRTFAFLLAVLMVMTGIYVAPKEVKESGKVQAAETLETGVALKYTEDDATEVTYDITVANPMPVPVDTTYQDYLFAGWFKDAACTLGNAVTPAEMAEAGVEEGYYAKFVPRDTLDVKFQTTRKSVVDFDKDGNLITADSAIRFISSVDSLNYRAIGFNVNGKDLELDPYVVERIESTMKENTATDAEFVTYEFSPKIVGEDSEFFFTGKYAVAKNDDKNYTVKAYYITMDGTQVYGDARVVGLQDGDANVLNLVVNGTVSGETATVTNYTDATGTPYTEAATATVISKEGEPTTVRVVLDNNLTVAGLTSAAKVTIGGATGIYRNYNTTHVPASGTTPVADTSWYYADTTADNFVIATSADLYGLAKLVDGKQVFTGKTVCVVRDIEINKGEATKDGWVADSGEVAYLWEPIGSGSAGYQFNGTFDGDGNTISGVYMQRTGSYSGLFAAGQAESYFKNIAITNSYFESNHDYLSSLVAFSYGNGVINCYSDAIIVNTGTRQTTSSGTTTYGAICVGGLVARFSTDNSTTENNKIRPIKNCWFAGEIYTQNKVSYVGGIVGQIFRGLYYEVENVLMTGTIEYAGTGKYAQSSAGKLTYTNPYVGNIWGHGNSDATIKLDGCVDAGRINLGEVRTTETIGSFMGRYNSSKTASSTTNCYSANQIYQNGSLSETFNAIAEYGSTVKPTIDTETSLSVMSQTELKSLLGENSSNYWMCHANARGTKAYGTPMLKQFADLWLEKNFKNYKMTADTSWYDPENPETEYTLLDEEELMGLATLVNSGNTFEDITVKLGRDMKMNEVDEEILDAWEAGTATPNNIWTPIGKTTTSTKCFNGIFDGAGHTISGLYASSTNCVSLFGATELKAQIKNVSVTDSVFKATGDYLGGVVGYFRGTCIENVYSDASLVFLGSSSSELGVGGIVGRLRISAHNISKTVKNCWYSGNILLENNTVSRIGGIIGDIQGDYNGFKLTMENCLFNGKMTIEATSTVSGLGGIFGVNGNNMNHTFVLKNCVNAGVIEDLSTNTSGVGLFASSMSATATGSSVTNCYVVDDGVHNVLSETPFGMANAWTGRDAALANVKVERSVLLAEDEADLITLFGEDATDVWMCDLVSNDTNRGTPVLKQFVQLWLSK